MGRSVNSFTSYVGHAEETIDKSKVSLPEKDLTGNSYYAAMGKKGGRPKLYG